MFGLDIIAVATFKALATVIGGRLMLGVARSHRRAGTVGRRGH